MEARLEECVPYLRSAPISFVTFSDVWMMMIGLDSTWDKSICEVPAQVYIIHSTNTHLNTHLNIVLHTLGSRHLPR